MSKLGNWRGCKDEFLVGDKTKFGKKLSKGEQKWTKKTKSKKNL